MWLLDQCQQLLAGADGLWRDEVIGRNSTEFLTAESRQAAEEVYLPLFWSTGRLNDIPYQMVKKTGEIMDVLLSSTAEWDAENESKFSLAVITDVTELLKAEKELRASEAKYRRLHENMRDGYALVDMKGSIKEYNEIFRTSLGYTDEELARLTLTDLTPPKWHEMERMILDEQVLLDGYSSVYEKEYIRKDGTVFPVELRTYLHKDENWVDTGTWSVIRDITERKQAEQARKNIEENYRDLADSISDIFVALNEELRFTYWNRASAALSGISAADALGRSLCEIFPKGADVDELEWRLLDIMVTRKSKVFTYTFEQRGHMVAFEVSAYPSQSGLVVFGRDISLRMQMEEELRRTHDELEQRVRERTEELEKSRLELEGRNQALLQTSRQLELSLDRYADLYDKAPLSYITLDNKGIIQEINLTGAVMLGADRDALQGISLANFIVKENIRRLHGHLRRCRRNVGHVTSELFLKPKDGTGVPVLLQSVPVVGPEGEELLYRTAITDITQQKLAEQKLLRLNRLYVVLSEADNAVVRASDRDDLFREICRIAIAHGGFSLAWIGLINHATGLVRPIAASGVDGLELSELAASRETEGPCMVLETIRRGSYCISNDFLADPLTEHCHDAAARFGSIKSAAAVVLKLNGEVIGTLCLYAAVRNFFDPQFVALLQQIGADITYAIDSLDRAARHQEAEQALRRETLERLQAVEALRQKEQMLMLQNRQAAMGEMIGNIAHQWRQPLNNLGLIVQEMPVVYQLGELNDAYLEQKVNKAMQLILHMSQTIDDFRNFFRPDNEKILFKATGVIEKTVSLVDVSFRGKGIKLKIDAEKDILMYGYPNEFSQVIMNLLTNAKDALLERQVARPEIRVRLFMADGKAVCTIADNAGESKRGSSDGFSSPTLPLRQWTRGRESVYIWLKPSLIPTWAVR